jgi:hypothetical protein
VDANIRRDSSRPALAACFSGASVTTVIAAARFSHRGHPLTLILPPWTLVAVAATPRLAERLRTRCGLSARFHSLGTPGESESIFGALGCATGESSARVKVCAPRLSYGRGAAGSGRPLVGTLSYREDELPERSEPASPTSVPVASSPRPFARRLRSAAQPQRLLRVAFTRGASEEGTFRARLLYSPTSQGTTLTMQLHGRRPHFVLPLMTCVLLQRSPQNRICLTLLATLISLGSASSVFFQVFRKEP